MKLTELEATFVVFNESRPNTHRKHVSFEEAQGVFFICPKCQDHSVGVAFRGRGAPPGVLYAAEWAVSGTGLHDLTLSPSIDLSHNDGGCGWHGFVQNGEAR